MGIVQLLADTVSVAHSPLQSQSQSHSDRRRDGHRHGHGQPASLRHDVSLSLIRLLFQLSFSAECAQQICDCGLLQWLVQCLHLEHTQEFAIKCLYNLSVVDEHRSQICYTNAVAIVVEMIIDFEERLVPPQLMALAINLATSQ